MHKTTPHVRSTFGSWDVEKCTPLWREAHFEVKSVKNWRARSTFGRSDVVSRGRRRGFSTLPNVSKTWGFCGFSKNDGGRGTFEEDLQRWISRGRRSTRDMFIRDVRRSGRISWEGLHFGASDLQVCEGDFAWLVQHFVWLGITFSWQAQHFRQMERENRNNALAQGRQLCTQLSILEGRLAPFFRFWCCQLRKLRKSRRIVSFLMLSSSKTEETSQSWIVFDVVKFKKLRKSRRIASFSSLQKDR